MTETLVCTFCGFQTELSTYWALIRKSVKCPACLSEDYWKKPFLVKDRKIFENDSWKKFLFLRMRERLAANCWKTGELTPNRQWKKCFDYYDEMRRENPEMAKAMDTYLHIERMRGLTNQN